MSKGNNEITECHYCGSRRLAKYIYGLLAKPDRKTRKKFQSGEYIAGGCVFSPGFSPTHVCRDCGMNLRPGEAKWWSIKFRRKFRRAAEDRRERERWFDAARGSLVGGAAGDALGFPVEFASLDEIYEYYSDDGIREYVLDPALGKALITDDTQMTLFTANGILCAVAQGALRGFPGLENQLEDQCIYTAYLDWLQTQELKKEDFIGSRGDSDYHSWLLNVDELWAVRAPGLTCLHALRTGRMGTIEDPFNNSKGCGGVMRVAPLALYYSSNRYYGSDYMPYGSDYMPYGLNYMPTLMLLGAKVAALTHGHSLGYMPAAALVHIISRIVYGGCTLGDCLDDIVDECCVLLQEVFAGDRYVDDLIALMRLAQELARNDEVDVKNIALLGQGWVAEEALAIALYCSLKYSDDFSTAIIAAVNHSGDSDSTGSITGNIVGAAVGYSGIEQKWKDDLQLHDVIVEVADDLCFECLDRRSFYGDTDWSRKYVYGWKAVESNS